MIEVFAFASLCLLPAFFGFLPRILSAQNANQSSNTQRATTAQASPTASPAASPSPSPSPSPTPPLTLHQWGAVTLFHGLPSDRVRAIAQDRDGSMWFGTDGGLAKYDGRRTEAMTVEGLMSKRVLALKVDEDGALWVGTEAGAGRVVDGEFRPVAETAGKVITAIVTPERGRAVLASEEGVIFDCRAGDGDALAVRTIPNKPLESADFERPGPLNLTSLAMKENMLYIGTLSRGVITIENDQTSEIRSTPRPFFVGAIERDARGRLWYGAKAKSDDSGLYEAGDAMRPKKVGTGLGTVAALRAGAHEDLWVGTDGRGVFHYDAGARLIERFTFEETAGGLRSDHVYAIFVDREEVVWFGTDRGVCRYDTHAPRVENVSANAESNFVRTIFQTSGGLLLSGTNRGLFAYDADERVWEPVAELSQSPVFAITEDKKGRVVVGAASGLYRSERPWREGDGASGLRRIETASAEGNASDNVRAVAQFQDRTYVAAFGRGLERLDEGRRTMVWPDAQSDPQARDVISLHADRSGRLWIGTALAGVFVFDGQRVTTLPALERLKGSAVRAIHDGGGGQLWLASARGLFLYQANELKEVAPNVDTRAVASADEGTSATGAAVWCATGGGGILKVLIDEQAGPVISRLDAEQGLPSQNAFAVLALPRAEGRDETLLIGTNRGVARYVPGRVAPVLRPTRIVGQRAHSLAELRNGLKLDYPQNGLLLDVSATSSRTFPEQFQYAFQLRDAAGRVVKQKFSHDAQFPMESLKAGRYSVTARAFSKDLVASEPLTFEFDVAGSPFPWTTALLSVLLLLALIALWWGYHQNRSLARTGEKLSDTNRQLADARVQLANETEAERRRIARDLHDQTLADLRHLLMLTDQLPANGGDRPKAVPPAVFRSEIESISNEIRRICEDLSPSVLENVGFSAALEWALSNTVTHSPAERKFEYEFVADDQLDERLNFPRATQMQIYRIVQEAMSNISRHAAASRVSLDVKASEGGDFLLTIEDNGRDFDPHDRKIKQGRGLANIRARASMIEAEVNWAKREGGGTKFTLRKAGAVKV